MNLIEKVKTMVDGAVNLTTWVGSGGEVVSYQEAQGRANICRTCPRNKMGMEVTQEVAEATLKFLAFKNDLDLKVAGEDDLHHCEACGCVLKLLIWEPQNRVRAHMTGPERQLTPEFCWKLKP